MDRARPEELPGAAVSEGSPKVALEGLSGAIRLVYLREPSGGPQEAIACNTEGKSTGCAEAPGFDSEPSGALRTWP